MEILQNEEVTSYASPELTQAEVAWRFLRLMSLMIFSDDDGRPAGLCFISTPQFKMNKNSLLNQS